ncbi:hypothetical protein [Morganella sp. EGD-HP17]|uniref:hypothetical protein n=1 Tax=Morganella sp. EGD-HP17 TaxID=1435146 RepID=UPI0003FABE14|nr:hypothetical protein [Morganella sp. EGD-HP17]ETO41251.1 hypothetical protein X965_11140 [Morganella sp. EGD-HP17]
MANVGEIVYQVSMDVKGLLTGEQQVNKAMSGLERSSGKATEAMSKLDTTAAQVSTALKMPTIDKLSRDLAQLSGKMGANSAAADKAATANNKFTGVIGTVSGALGAGYIGNIGSATNSLLRHAQAAIAATAAEVENAEAIKREAAAYQASASQMALAAKAKKEMADAAVKAAESEVANLSGFEASVDARQKELALIRDKQVMAVKEAENSYKILASEGNLREVQKAKNALYATEDKIKKHLATTGREVEQVENKLTAAKAAQAKVTQELNAATALEQKAKTTAAAANDTLAAAQARAAQASTAQSVAMNGLRNVMALFGGPTGIILLAVAGVYALYQAMSDNSKIDEYKNKINEAIQKLDELTAAQAKAAAEKTKLTIELETKNLKNVEQEIKDTQARIDEMMSMGQQRWQQQNQYSGLMYSQVLANLSSKLTTLKGDYDTLGSSVSDLTRKQQKFTDVGNDHAGMTESQIAANKAYNESAKSLIESNELLSKTLETGSPAAAEMEVALESLRKKMIDIGVEAGDADIAVSNLRNLFETKADNSFELMLNSIEENVTALKIEMQEGAVAAAEYRATLNATAMGMTDDDQINRYISGMKKLAELQQQRSEQNKKGRKSGSKKDTAADALKKQAEALERLNTGYREGSLEMAKYDAAKSLGDKASSAQIAQAEKLVAEKFAIEQRSADQKAALDANVLAKAKQTRDDDLAQLERQLKAGDVTFEQSQKRRAEINAEYAKKAAEENAKSAVSPVQEMAAQVDPVQALANEHAQKLALIKDFENQKVITAQQSLELMNAANTEYEDARLNAQWEIWRNQSQANQFLADGLDALGQRSSNVLTGLVTGTQNLNDAFRNVASTIIDEAVGALVQMGMQQIKNMVTENAMRKASSAQAIADATVTGSAINSAMAPAAATTSIATMGSAATWGMMAMSSAIPAMIAIAGARYNGGPVDANKMYRVGENGQPEIFKASNGHQYMIPGDSGKVISNRQMGGGGGISMGDMHFNFQVQAPNGITQKEVTMITGMVKGTVYDILMTEIRSGAIQGNQRY